MNKHLFSALTAAALLTSGLQSQTISRYDISNARLSGFGSWEHVYTGTILLQDNGLYSYTGGSGTLNDGLFADNADHNQLFSLSDNSVITLYLSGTYSLSSLNIFGGEFSFNFIPGVLTGATIGFGGASATVLSTPFSASGICGSGPCDDALTFSGTSLAGLSGDILTLSDFQGSVNGLFSMSEISVSGIASTVPEPSSLALLALGLGIGAAFHRRRTLSG